MHKRVLLSAFLLSSILLSVSAQKSPRPLPSPQSQPRNEDQDVVRITTNLVQVVVVTPPADIEGSKMGFTLLARAYELFTFPFAGLGTSVRTLSSGSAIWGRSGTGMT